MLLLAIALIGAACDDEGGREDERVPGAGALREYDPDATLDATEEPVERTGAFVATKVTYRSLDETVPGYLSLPTAGGQPFPCIVVQHGFNGSKEDARGVWEPFAAAGFGTLAIDARLHGERGTPSQLEAASGNAVDMRAVLEGTAVDLRRGLDYLSRRPECDEDRLGFLGLSMGAFLGAVVAGADERVRATALVVGGGDWRTFFEQTELPELGWARESAANLDDAVEELDPIDPANWVGLVSPRPVLMINGDADTIVPPDSARALHEAAGEPKDVVWFQGGHLALGVEFIRTVVTIFGWFVVNLGLAPSGEAAFAAPHRALPARTRPAQAVAAASAATARAPVAAIE